MEISALHALHLTLDHATPLERDHLLEENRRLQGERSESPTLLEVSAYQSQMDTLQWQLKHVESNRQMYRAVMEQVLKFLERVQKCLDLIQVNKSTNPNQSPNKNRSRVPRSRSVHTVAHTSPNSRTSSPSPTHQSYHSAHQVQRANSVNHMQDSYSHPLREFSWRSARPLHQIEDVVTPEKLSQDTFRLLRTIQSLVNTREPDLTSHLTPSSSDLTLSRPAPDTNSVGSCSSLLHSSYTGGGGVGSGDSTRKSLESSSSCSTHCDDLDILASSSPRGRVKSSPSVPHGTEDELSWGRVKSSPPVPHGTEDESGFSSLSSFHESGLPETRGYQELGLPLVESLETRWQPPPHAPPLNERIRVLWV
ncbi:hypothetical protein M8J77_017065 [Diaphorina citri]|nr:hypothetical protein M8J77_017065 [Diaphorina citri]